MCKDGFSYTGGRVLSCDAFSETNMVYHGFSSRKEGTSSGIFTSLNLGVHTMDEPESVQHNFELFCRDISVDPQHLVVPQQVHGTSVRTVGAEDRGKGLFSDGLSETDALVTNCPGVALAAFYADCTPILLFDPVGRVIAAVHSGWRGTAGKIVQQAVSVMRKQFGSSSKNILAALGPSIKQCHFEVDEDVYLEFLCRFRGMAERCMIQKNGKYYIDTDSLNVHSLLEMGLLQENISVCRLCTYCEQDLFYSHRREGETGRMCAVIELR